MNYIESSRRYFVCKFESKFLNLQNQVIFLNVFWFITFVINN